MPNLIFNKDTVSSHPTLLGYTATEISGSTVQKKLWSDSFAQNDTTMMVNHTTADEASEIMGGDYPIGATASIEVVSGKLRFKTDRSNTDPDTEGTVEKYAKYPQTGNFERQLNEDLTFFSSQWENYALYCNKKAIDGTPDNTNYIRLQRKKGGDTIELDKFVNSVYTVLASVTAVASILSVKLNRTVDDWTAYYKETGDWIQIGTSYTVVFGDIIEGILGYIIGGTVGVNFVQNDCSNFQQNSGGIYFIDPIVQHSAQAGLSGSTINFGSATDSTSGTLEYNIDVGGGYLGFKTLAQLQALGDVIVTGNVVLQTKLRDTTSQVSFTSLTLSYIGGDSSKLLMLGISG